jgi:hypothetical protein
MGVKRSRGQQVREGRRSIAQVRRRNPAARGRPAPSALRVGIRPATVNLAPAARAIGGGLAAATTLDVGDIGPRNFARAIGGDIKALAVGSSARR